MVTGDGGNSQSRKVVAGHHLPISDFAVPVHFNIHAAQIGEGENARESLGLMLESLDLRIRKIIVLAVYRFDLAELHKLLRILHRQHFEQNRIDQAEHSSIRPNAERQRHYDHYGEARGATEDPHRVTNILPDVLDEADPSSLPAIFLNLSQATKLQAEAARGLLARQPGPKILLHLLLEMELQLLINLLSNGGTAEERTKTNAKVAKHEGAAS
jgi:hypothetical protein